MPRLPKKTNNSAASEYHRKCHMAYVPRTVKVVKHPISRNMRYEQYIELNDHCKQETSNENKCYIQEELPGKKKEVHEVKQEIIRVEEEDIPDEPIMECYIDKSYYSSPVIVNTEINKVSTPIKKINFNLPKDKSFHDLEEDEKPPPDERMDWKDYHELSVIHKFMDDLEADFPSLCTTGIIGTSVEGRNLKILKISNSNASNACVWVDAGIHAREWIAPAVNTYLADHISRNFDKLPESIRNKDWYFLPVLNPDGYEYTHTTDRMWRKNRAWYGGQCVGVDLNRNFSIGWGGKGSSDQPNNAFFRGPHPFSEPESSAIRDVLLKSGVNFKVYITLHSYGQIIIFPYACSSELAPDYVRLLEGATVMSKAIYDTNGNTYKVGISRDVMYGAAGTSNDFAHGAASIPYCYLIELRSKKHKFKLPKEEIEETCNEILSCVKALMEFVDTYKYTKRSESDQDINVVKKNVSFLEKKKSTAERSDSYLSVVNSYIGKRDSYDKRSYSYINRSDSGIEKGNSFVRWINLPSKEEDPKENTGDAKKTDTYTNENNFFKKNDVSVQQTYDKNKGNDSFEKINDSFVKETDNLKIASDSFLQPNDYVDASDSFMKNTDSFMKKADYYMKKTDSYMKKTNSYMKKTESYMRKTDSYMKNTDSRSKKTNSFEENDSLEAEIAG